MNFFPVVIFLVSIELFKTQGPRFGLKTNSIKDKKTYTKQFNECNNCTNDKLMLSINTWLKEYQNASLTSCNLSHNKFSKWCIKRLKVLLNKAAFVFKFYPNECECWKSCY
ncbi:uncharacterized protein LOC124810821 [Hydra vulgaris]|uniref:uncharacterized protein LOC124810821 n=1 Tax=Hydra vulgaris TaxID=6087 RepID=UPI001F5E3A2C|nr:uncharacterized protein LOC124810821 [Hydra vulgaris]